jgi:hypothetical protein
MKTSRISTICAVGIAATLLATTRSEAGFILAGTDADDHGFASGGVNQ